MSLKGVIALTTVKCRLPTGSSTEHYHPEYQPPHLKQRSKEITVTLHLSGTLSDPLLSHGATAPQGKLWLQSLTHTHTHIFIFFYFYLSHKRAIEAFTYGNLVFFFFFVFFTDRRLVKSCELWSCECSTRTPTPGSPSLRSRYCREQRRVKWHRQLVVCCPGWLTAVIGCWDFDFAVITLQGIVSYAASFQGMMGPVWPYGE